MTFNFVDPVPCDVENDVEIIMRDVASLQKCPDTLSACNVTVDIVDCVAPVGRRKRQDESLLVITYTVPLSSNVTFDLVEYYRTLSSKWLPPFILFKMKSKTAIHSRNFSKPPSSGSC